MVLEDINSARPRYLHWTLFRDYHYAVFNEAGDLVTILVTEKGGKRSYWVTKPDFRKESIVYENQEMIGRLMMCRYITDEKDLTEFLEANQPSGEYALSLVDASGKRLYSISIWI